MVGKEEVKMLEKEIDEGIYPVTVDPYHPIKKCLAKPRPQDYNSLEEWQLAYDEWYRNQPGHCPNFAGHF